MKFLTRNAKWIAIAVLSVAAVFLIVSGLTQKQPGGTNIDKGKNESVDKDKNESVDKDTQPEINVVEEDGVEPLAIGFKFGYTKYENGVEDFGYTGEGLTIYEGLRKDQCVFFATANGRDTISKYREKLTAWEGDGGVFVNGYRENAPLVKYSGNAYYIYLTDGGCNIVPEVGMKVSIQGTILDGKGGKATFHPATFEYKGDGVWEIVSRKAIKPQEKPAQHVTIKIEGWDTTRNDEANLFFVAQKGCGITKTRESLVNWLSGGIYVDGERVAVPVIKHSAVGFYVYLASGSANIKPVKGMKVGIQGTLSDGKNTTTFEPVTFEYTGDGKWKVISRAQVIPESDIRPQPKPGEKEVYIYGSTRKDTNSTFFETSSNDTLPYTVGSWDSRAVAIDEETSGVYVNNVKKNVPLIKHNENSYLIHWPHGGMTPTAGMKISIQGTFKMGDQSITFHPVTFEYQENGKSTIISRKAITPEEEKPGEVVKVTVSWNADREDDCLFMKTDKADAITKMREPLTKWISGGVYADGVKVSVRMIKHDTTGYYLDFAASNCEVTPVAGMKISVQGVLTDGFNSVEFLPATFEYNGNEKWTLVSRDEIQEKPEPTEATLTWNSSRTDLGCLFFVSDIAVEHTSKVEAIPTFTEGGIYVDGVLTEVTIVRHGANNYFMYFDARGYKGTKPVAGTKVGIQGTFTMGGQTLTVNPVTFEYDGNGTWTVVSRDVIVEVPKPTVATLTWNSSRTDLGCLFFVSDIAVEHTSKVEAIPTFAEGGIYVDGVLTEVTIVRHGANNYFMYFDARGYKGTKPVAGTKVGIQGTFTMGGQTLTVNPVTFEYDGNGTWTVVSRDVIVETPAPSEPTKATLSWNSSRTDAGILFFVSDIAVEHTDNLNAFPNFTDGGVYINGVLTKVRFVRHGAKNYYVYFSASDYTGVRPTNGTKVSIQGTFTMGGQTLTVNPVTFEYDGNGTWTVVSREEVKEVVVANLTWNTSRVDTNGNLFLVSDVAVEHSGTVDAFPTFIDGGIYVNDEKKKVRIVRHGANNYYIYFAASNYEGERPVQGTRVRIEGTFVLGGQTLTVKSVTFEYDGAGSWSIVS